MKVQFWITLTLLVLTGNAAQAADSGEIGFKLYRGYIIVVRGSIAGMTNLNFLVDTGAMPSVIDESIADRLKLDGTKLRLSVFTADVQTRQVVLPDLTIGPVQVNSLPVVTRDLSQFEAGIGTRIDAMVGSDVLQKAGFSIDYESKKIRFLPDNAPPFRCSRGTRLGFIVTAQINNRAVRLLVDTGAKDLILFRRRIEKVIEAIKVNGSKISSNMAGESQLSRLDLKEITVAGRTYRVETALVLDTPEDTLPDFDGLLGLSTLKIKRVDFAVSGQMTAMQ
ncbi:MAG TPA: aspartyl protease family protein [Acidobacteriota bacterium]